MVVWFSPSLLENTKKMKKTFDTTHPYFTGFDYLRVFFAFAVVAWHTKALGNTGLISEQFSINLKDFIYGNIFLLAVPLFVQVSLFLYLFNRKNKEGYFLKRILNVSFLYLFWMALLILIFYKENGLKTFLELQFWFSGGATPLYFLLVILILTIITEGFLHLGKIMKRNSFLIINFFALIVSLILILGKVYFFGSLSPKILPFVMSHWSALNFLPYVFSAIIFDDLRERGIWGKRISWKLAATLLVFMLGAALIEYLYLPSSVNFGFDGMVIPPYSRLSLILGTWLVFYLAVAKDYQVPAPIKTLAGLTLGIYIMHIFVMNILAGLLGSQFDTIRNTYIYFGLVAVITASLAYFLKEKRIV